MILLHAGEALAPHDLWRAWSFEPGVILPLAVTTVLYVSGISRILRRSTYARPVVTREMFFFVTGFVVLTLALVSPVHRAGSSLFSAHMIQHELLMAVAAPLLVLGKPMAAFMWGLPERMRRPVSRVFSLSIPPLAAFLLHAAAIWVWHAPRLYDASVNNEFAHIAQHSSFLGSALLFWWSLFHSRSRKGSEGAAIIYLFLTGIHTTLLGALIALSSAPFYSVYTDATTTSWGLTAIEDQQLGGIIMWVPAGMVYLGAALYLMLRWINQSAERVAKREAFIRTTAAIAMLVIMGCSDHRDAQWAAEMTGGSTARGREALRSYGCMSCHAIPGVRGADALVGPPLAGIASRSYIGGVLSNTPEHMIQWLRNPPAIDSKTAMPNMNVTERDARDMAAYLYTLR